MSRPRSPAARTAASAPSAVLAAPPPAPRWTATVPSGNREASPAMARLSSVRRVAPATSAARPVIASLVAGAMGVASVNASMRAVEARTISSSPVGYCATGLRRPIDRRQCRLRRGHGGCGCAGNSEGRRRGRCAGSGAGDKRPINAQPWPAGPRASRASLPPFSSERATSGAISQEPLRGPSGFSQTT